MVKRKVSAPQSGVESHFASAIRRAIHERLGDSKFNIAALAESLDVSRQYLYEFCMLRFGRSPHEMLELLRIERVLGLLASGERSLYKICSACGYANYQTFRKAFRKRLGLSPSACRGRLSNSEVTAEELKKIPEIHTSKKQQ